MTKPDMKNDPLYQLLREGKIDEFNTLRERGHACELGGADFRGTDLRGMNAEGLDLSGCYFRQADLRGVDLRRANLEGASINGAKISGTYFPPELDANELMLSLLHGTRMRYRR